MAAVQMSFAMRLHRHNSQEEHSTKASIHDAPANADDRGSSSDHRTCKAAQLSCTAVKSTERCGVPVIVLDLVSPRYQGVCYSSPAA